MDAIRSFTTSVADRETGLRAEISVLPAASLREEFDYRAPENVTGRLGVVGQRLSPSQLPYALTFVLDTAGALEGLSIFQPVTDPNRFWAEPNRQQLLQFSEFVAFSELVPVEHSPWDLHSLATLATALRPSTLMLGAVTGLAAGAGTPLVLLTVPAGIVLVGSAQLLNDALRAYVHMRLAGVPDAYQQR